MTRIRRYGDAAVLDCRGPLREVAGLRMYSALSVVLGGHEPGLAAGPAAAIAALRRSQATGVLSALDAAVISFRVDPLADRWELRDLVAAELGWRNDPRDWQVNLTRRGDLLLAQVGALYRSSRFPTMARLPASTNPVVAALLVQLLKVGAGQVVYDPFCGSGTLLVEAFAYDGTAVLIGSDSSPTALAAAAANRPMWGGGPLRADAARLPVATGSVDRVVANLPFGKRVGSHAANIVLYPAFLAELNRVLRADGRAVLLTEDKELFRRSVRRAPGVRVLREVRLASGGLHPSAFVLERTRTARGRRP
ncbi:MAG: RNA methylase [Pseudonocardiales bacterium]|nr:MAG: RNA methylase [Pseudonocardiales bacterium]